MTLKSPSFANSSCYTDAFPSSAAFDTINEALQADPASRDDAVKKTKAIFGFQLKNSAGETEGWFVDLKDKGEVGKGSALGAGRKADGEYNDTMLWLGAKADDCNSDSRALRRRFRQASNGPRQCTESVHVGQAEDQRQYDDGDEARASVEESADTGQAVRSRVGM